MTAEHRQVTAWLLLKCYLVLPLFFILMRAIGVTHFFAEAPPWTLPNRVGFVVMTLFYMFSVAVPLRAMSEISWKWAISISAVFYFVSGFVTAIFPSGVHFVEISAMILLPLAFGGKLKYSVPIYGGITLYVVIFIFGARGYLFDGQFSPEWIVFSTLDFYAFIFLVCINKFKIYEVIDNVFIFSLDTSRRLRRSVVRKVQKWKSRFFNESRSDGS